MLVCGVLGKAMCPWRDAVWGDLPNLPNVFPSLLPIGRRPENTWLCGLRCGMGRAFVTSTCARCCPPCRICGVYSLVL